MQSNPFQGKRLGGQHFCSLCTAPWGNSHAECLHLCPLELLLCWRGSTGLKGTSSTCCQSWVFAWDPSLLREKLGVGGSLAILCLMWEELMQECVSAFPTHFHVGLFSFAPNVEVTQLVSGLLSEKLLHV